MTSSKISSRQFLILVFLFTIGSSILIIPTSQAYFAKQDGWIATMIGTGIGLLLVWLYVAIGNLCPGASLIQLNEKVFGKWIGKFVSLLLLSTVFLAGPTVALYYVGEFMTTQIMPTTPLSSINFLFAIIVIIGVRLGLEVVARSAELLLPWFFLFFFTLVLFVLPKVEIENIQPVLEEGVRPLGAAVLFFLSIAILPSVVLLMIFPSSVHEPMQASGAFYKGYLVAAIVLASIIVLCILVLGADLTARTMYPSYILAKKIYVGHFLQRIEAIMAFMWFISLYFRVALYLYVTALGLAQIFNLNDYRTLVLPLGLLLVTLSLIVYPNAIYGINWDIHTRIPYTISIGLIYPLILLIVAWVRRTRSAHL